MAARLFGGIRGLAIIDAEGGVGISDSSKYKTGRTGGTGLRRCQNIAATANIAIRTIAKKISNVSNFFITKAFYHMEFFQNHDITTIVSVIALASVASYVGYKVLETRTRFGSRWTFPMRPGGYSLTTAQYERLMDKWFPKIDKDRKRSSNSVKGSSESVKDGDTEARRVVENPEHQT